MCVIIEGQAQHGVQHRETRGTQEETEDNQLFRKEGGAMWKADTDGVSIRGSDHDHRDLLSSKSLLERWDGLALALDLASQMLFQPSQVRCSVIFVVCVEQCDGG